MTWEEFYAARLLLGEERVGSRIEQIEADEDAAFERSARMLRGRG